MDLRRGESEIRGVAEKMERVGLPSEILDDGEYPPMGRIRFVTHDFRLILLDSLDSNI